MRADPEAVRARWGTLVAPVVDRCPHGAPEGACVPCEALRRRTWRKGGQPLKPWCPQGHLKDRWSGTQLVCSTCHREAQRRWKARKRATQN